MANTKVTTSVRDWATEVAMVRAAYAMDYAQAGVVAVEDLKKPIVYEFTGAAFRDSGKKPSA